MARSTLEAETKAESEAVESEDTMADPRIMAERAQARARRHECFRQKHPYRKRPAEQEYLLEGTTFFEDATAEVNFDPIKLRRCDRGVSPWANAAAEMKDAPW